MIQRLKEIDTISMLNVSTYGVLLLVVVLLIIEPGQSRFITFDSPANELVSDGSVDDRNIDRPHDHSFLVFKGIEGVEEEKCKHMYGFLPCTSNLAGHLFLVVVYEYLLFLGEKYVAAGSELLFQMLGPGFFGACAFDVLGALPEALIVLVSGLPTEESAKDQVYTGIGLLVGSTVLLLTLVWGTCVIVGKQEFSNKLTYLQVPKGRSVEVPNSTRSVKTSPNKKCRGSFLFDFGVATDKETSYIAMIMILSLLPFIVLQLPEILNLTSGKGIVILISLVISITLLLIYFLYQVFWPWIQKRRLEYVKHENLMVGFLQHVQRHASGKLLTSAGVPNTPVIKRIFRKIDIDADDSIIPSELKSLIMEIKFGNEEMEEVMKDFDINHDNKISRDEFINGFIKWLDRRKQIIEKEGSSSRKTQIDLYQEKMKEYATNKYLILRILRHVQCESLRSLVTNDGKPHMPSIAMLFRKFDLDGDNYISLSELKKLIQQIEFGNLKVKMDDVAEQIMEEIDTDGDHKIDKKEFVNAVRNLLDPDHDDDQEPRDDLYLEAWNETDKLVDETTSKRATNSVIWNWFKSIGMLLLGTVILTLLADPLIKAVQNFSKAANINSFFVSFVAVPLATRSRVAMSAISSARRKKARTTSLTFSEIYGFVFMNNVLGLSVLLALVHVRGLRWDFSAEVLVVVIICVVMGLFASLRSKFPLWTCFYSFLVISSLSRTSLSPQQCFRMVLKSLNSRKEMILLDPRETVFQMFF